MTHEDHILRQAVLQRDARFDDLFVYAVHSTRIFCRPSCPSRKPKPDGFTCYPSATAAHTAGYRPCKRCRPDEAPDDSNDLRMACRTLDTNPDVTAAAHAAGCSVTQLARRFQNTLGITPRQYADAARLAGFRELLHNGRDVTTALYEAGYGSPSRVYESSSRKLGMTPRAYAAKGKGMTIRYTLFETPVGRVLLAATDKGICALRLGDDAATLEATLAEEFAAAQLIHDDTALAAMRQAFEDFLVGRSADGAPLDLVGTAFQVKVWEALRKIPRGQTVSYRELAQRLNIPRSTRAVARACATNGVAILVPCHRVVPKGGGLGGYRWGIDRKAMLLKLEEE
jgi:AraC family transcriptional regulator of adaptative response/methylated-DNA-[protein]-cysteine methyltransferase